MRGVLMIGEGKYISISKATSILDVGYERITWFIATGKLSSKVDVRDKGRKLVSLQGVYRLRDASPQDAIPNVGSSALPVLSHSTDRLRSTRARATSGFLLLRSNHGNPRSFPEICQAVLLSYSCIAEHGKCGRASILTVLT